jgi:uncharacterized membrane protein YphA (DoxX/SURF4 family)
MAAVSKIINLPRFEAQVLRSDLPGWLSKSTCIIPGIEPITAGDRLARLIATFLPWLELTCGVCLVFGWAVREAALTAAFLLILFIAASVASRTDDCQCFFVPTVLSHWPWWSHALRDTAFLLCALIVIFLPQPDLKVRQ